MGRPTLTEGLSKKEESQLHAIVLPCWLPDCSYNVTSHLCDFPALVDSNLKLCRCIFVTRRKAIINVRSPTVPSVPRASQDSWSLEGFTGLSIWLLVCCYKRRQNKVSKGGGVNGWGHRVKSQAMDKGQFLSFLSPFPSHHLIWLRVTWDSPKCLHLWLHLPFIYSKLSPP